MSDQLTFEWEGGMWEYDAYHDSIITAGNGGTKATKAAFTIFYNQGTQRYDLEQTLQPDEEMWIDVGKLISQRVPDKNGKTLPADLTSGSYQFRDLTNKGVGTLFEGKVIYDKTYGQVTYGCAACCGWANPAFWYDPLDVLLNGWGDQGVNAYDTCDYEVEDVSDSFYSNWSTGNTSIATVDAYGTHTGVGLGSTTSFTDGRLNNDNQESKCPMRFFYPQGPTNVTPTILLGGCSGTNITNTTQSVVVGQQIALCASYTLPSGAELSSQSWTVAGTTVGAFNTGPSNGGSTPANFNGQSTTFYWVAAANSQTVIFTVYYTLGGDDLSATAQATFNIAGPTGVSVNAPTTQAAITSGPYLQFGNFPSSVGIQFTAAATPPSGYSNNFAWVQTVSASATVKTSSTTESCTFSGSPGLDTSYPFASGGSTNDSPKWPLASSDVEDTFSVNAVMFLMWSPGLTNSIQVPLGSVTWQFFGDAVQNTSTQTWSVQSDSSGSANAFQASSTYPTWTSVVTGQATCR